MKQFVIIGNPEHRRVEFFQTALHSCGLKQARVVAYDTLLREGPNALAEVDSRHIVRLESPGQNAAVQRALIERGARVMDSCRLDHEALAAMERGRIIHPDQWYRGFADLLTELDGVLAPRRVRWINHPHDIAVMFDKTACHTRLNDAGLQTPQRLVAPRNYDQLRDEMRAVGVARVFVKLRYSSSGSGIIALQTAGARVTARTTIETVTRTGEVRLYNSRRIGYFDDERAIAELVDALCQHDVHVERWVPKAGCDGAMYDLRVMLIGGHIRHVVVRQSAVPMTNLHLGGKRGDAQRVLGSLPPATLERAWADCRRVAEIFPRSVCCGIDLLFTPSLRKHAVLEANAFGDFLPGIIDAGETTHAAQISLLAADDTKRIVRCG
jgi:glutathione synthase/RimK-type ligase-like ATP-grasp enzyme